MRWCTATTSTPERTAPPGPRARPRGRRPSEGRRLPSRLDPVRRAAPWIAIAGGVLAGGVALDAAGLPSSYLFAALLLGLAIALARPASVELHPLAFRASQAVAGVSLGAYLQAEALRSVAGALLPVLPLSAGGAPPGPPPRGVPPPGAPPPPP